MFTPSVPQFWGKGFFISLLTSVYLWEIREQFFESALIAQWLCISFVNWRLSVQVRLKARFITASSSAERYEGVILWVLVLVTRHRKPIGNRPNDATPINTITYKRLYYGCGYPIPHTLFFRGLAERFIASVLKTEGGKTPTGSNPVPSTLRPIVQRIEHSPSKRVI